MKIKRFYCTFEGCVRSFRSEDQLTTHSLSHTMADSDSELQETLVFECDICHIKFPTKRSVSTHKRFHRNIPKLICSQKIINLLTSRLSESEFYSYEIPVSPHTLEEIHLPPVTESSYAELPQFSITFGNNYTLA